MLKSIEGNFDHPEVNELLTKHFIELSTSPKGNCSRFRHTWFKSTIYKVLEFMGKQ